MSWVTRHIESDFLQKAPNGKVFVVIGARRVGKTSVIQKCIEANITNFAIGSGDDIDIRNILSSQSQTLINSAFSGYELVFIDEAQRIPDIGLGLKILVDANPNIKIIASGSSSFDLSNKIGEPLTGWQKIYKLYPVSISELVETHGALHVIQHLQNLLIYGTYPETLNQNNINDKKEYLNNIRNSYLFKDILELENIKNSNKLADLLKLIAFQIGNEVSLNELSNALGIAKQTVERYLDLLEKAFIIIKVNGFSSNLRKEVTKTSRYYFMDNGIRNSVINNFNDLLTRNDVGMLWENFCFIERMKKQEYQKIYANNYFWRTYDRQEVDLVEERDGKLFGFEFKWNSKKKIKAPKAFMENYSNAEFHCITPDNYLEFLL